MKRRTSVYVDGFNLYYGALKRTPYKWLDVRRLAEVVLEDHNEIHEVHYYTARVKDLDGKNQPRDQQMYLRALGTIPNLRVHFGSFLSNPKRRRLAKPVEGLPDTVVVRNTEEKGSDVNLGVHLVHHGWQGRYDVAVIVSNDTDLCEPIRIAREELGKVVGMISPRDNCSAQLKKAASFVRHIRRQHLRDAQFPARMIGSKPIIKPGDW